MRMDKLTNKLQALLADAQSLALGRDNSAIEPLHLLAVVADGLAAGEVFERLAVTDIQLACDVLRPVYDETEGKDGFVSLEVSPHLAHDTLGTVEQAHHLWDAVGRENLMIKVPGTPEGLPAIARLPDPTGRRCCVVGQRIARNSHGPRNAPPDRRTDRIARITGPIAGSRLIADRARLAIATTDHCGRMLGASRNSITRSREEEQ